MRTALRKVDCKNIKYTGDIMAETVETEKEFIKSWGKYTGFVGCLRYLTRWLLWGIIAIPLMLTALNPDIWSTVRIDRLAEEAATFFGLGFWLCILPSLLIGLGMWDKKNRKYKYLLGGDMRYMPFKERPWKRGEKWQIYGIGSLMAGFSAFIIFVSVTLMMGGNRSAVYMFRFSSAFFCFLLIYWIIHILYFRRHDGPLYIHPWAKIIMAVLWLGTAGAFIRYAYL